MKNLIEEKIEGFEYIIVTVGSEGGRSGDKTYVGSIEITLPQLEDQIHSPDEIKSILRPYLSQFAGAQFEFSAGRGFNSGSAVDIVIYGDDFDVSYDFSMDLINLLTENIEGIVDPVSSLDGGVPEYTIEIDKDRASSLGLSVSDVASAVSAYVEGLTPTTMWYSGDELDVLVRLRETDRDSIPDLDSQFISTSSGEQIALSNLASFVQGTNTESITRENKARLAHVTADLSSGFNINEVQPQIEQLISEQLIIPDGIEISYSGDSRSLSEMKTPFMIVIIVAFLMVFAVMASLFESLKDPFIIFLSIPLLLIGVVSVYMLTGETFSLFSAIGVVVLLGIVVNNGIVLVDYTNLLRSRGMPLMEACIEAGRSRFRPVLMSSLTTILGMIPLGFFSGEGMEIIKPIAQTVVGGLTGNTLLTLFFIPVMYSLVNRDRTTFRIKEKLNNKDSQRELEAVK
jgi:HAE1 family hydrophobic/amphiphilic exporter-1